MKKKQAREKVGRKRVQVKEPSNLDQKADWSSPSARIAWLVKSLQGGNKSRFARAVGFTHAAIIQVTKGRNPGRRLIEEISAKLGVDLNWLHNGKGKPFRGIASGDHPPGLPVSRRLLPGPPLDNLQLLSGEWHDLGDLLSCRSRYWLKLRFDEPILNDRARGFRANDELLMETDRGLFPRKERFCDRLCVVKNPNLPSELKLGIVDFCQDELGIGSGRLVLEVFEEHPRPKSLIRQEVYSHFPDGAVRHSTHTMALMTKRGRPQLHEVGEMNYEALPATIQHADIVGLWLGILRRSANIN
jgi:hypothetical protein